jgi:penicillin-binding protein 2
MAILVENGGHGGSTAAPIARAVLDFYLLGKEPPVKKEEGDESSEND